MINTSNLRDNVRINGHDLKLVDADGVDVRYECKGEMMYDDEHDEMPEPSLWDAVRQLSERLNKEGYVTDYNHSEKGWCEVVVIERKL